MKSQKIHQLCLLFYAMLVGVFSCPITKPAIEIVTFFHFLLYVYMYYVYTV